MEWQMKYGDMIYVDCERMKYPNTGLFAFCDNFAGSLCRQNGKHGLDFGFFVPERFVGRWGCEAEYLKVSPLKKLFFSAPDGMKIWHSTHNNSAYFPSGKFASVLTMHDLNFLYEKPVSKHGKYLKSFQKSIDRADRIVAISESTKRDMESRLDLRGKKVDVIYNGLNFFDGSPLPPQTPPHRPFLFTIGTVLPKKNFHVLPALLKGNDFDLVISGNKSTYVEKIMSEARKWGVESRVMVTGPVSEPVKHWYYDNCSAFLFPSIAEGFGLPVIEAMSYGKPLFLSDRTSLPEIGGDCAFYFVHDFDREEMRRQFEEGMSAFAAGRTDVEKMKARARSFSWDNTAEQYARIYRELL